jgi:hypothetical protein
VSGDRDAEQAGQDVEAYWERSTPLQLPSFSGAHYLKPTDLCKLPQKDFEKPSLMGRMGAYRLSIASLSGVDLISQLVDELSKKEWYTRPRRGPCFPVI